MANPARSILIRIRPCDPGQVDTSNSIVRVTGGNALPGDMAPTDTVVRVLDAQIVGLKNYIALMKAGNTTTTVETAITALL